MDRDEHEDRQPLRLPHISIEDAEAMVGLVSRTCDPGVDATIAERRMELCRGLAQLVDADLWFGCKGPARPDDPGDATALAYYDGGWRDHYERAQLVGIMLDTRINRLVNDVTGSAFRDGKLLTYRRTDKIDDATWYASPIGRIWNDVGMDQFMITIYPMENFHYSALGLHRRLGRPDFTPRDVLVTHIVWQQTEWLHRYDAEAPIGHKVLELSVRERQVLLLLLGGDTRNGIAAKLELSPHTIGDHVKAIYRKLEVTTRAELFARCTVIGG